MTVPLTPTVIVLDLGPADSNACTDTALPINLSHRECRPFPALEITAMRRTALDTGLTRKQTTVHSPARTTPNRGRH